MFLKVIIKDKKGDKMVELKPNESIAILQNEDAVFHAKFKSLNGPGMDADKMPQMINNKLQSIENTL